MGAPSEGEVAAVLAALAGVRKGDTVVAVGVGRIAQAALAAACAQPVLDASSAQPGTAAVAVVGDSDGLSAAALAVRPGGRLVGLSADLTEATRLALAVGVALRHTEPVGEQVAWSGQVPLDPAAGQSSP